jgi:hypothetical protein
MLGQARVDLAGGKKKTGAIVRDSRKLPIGVDALRQRSPEASLSVVAIGCRSPEDCHNAIADVLIDGAAMIGDARIGDFEELPKKLVDLLGVEFACQSCEAGEVRK